MEKRIHNNSDIEYFYEQGELAFYAAESLFYDPKFNAYHYPNGDDFHPKDHFELNWFIESQFEYKDGTHCYLPEQDPSWGESLSSKKVSSWGESDQPITNFIVLDMMSGCSKTTFNAGGHPETSWPSQEPCSFAVRSIVENRCMYWDRSLDGHCDCHLAYQHKTGDKVDLTRTKNLKKEDEIKDIPIDHHFKVAHEVDLETLQRWYDDEGRLKLVRDGPISGQSIFYDPQWDVYFDGKGKFLKTLTKRSRETNGEANDFVRNWQGPVAMKKQDLVTEGSIGVDTSGSMSPLEMHEFSHMIAKSVNRFKKCEWVIDSKDPCFDCAVGLAYCNNKCFAKVTYEKN